MKVCFVIPSFDFFLSHRLDLIETIASFHEVTVLTDTDEVNPKKLIQIKEMPFRVVHNPRRKESGIFPILKNLLLLRKSIKKTCPDQVFFITIECAIFGALISRFSGGYISNFVFSGLWPFFSLNSAKYKVLDFIAGAIFRFAASKKNSTYIFQNSDHRSLFIDKKIIDPKDTKLIYGNGIKLAEIDLSENLKEINARFCFVGRLAKSKGLEDFIDALEILESKNYKVSALIAGYREEGSHDYFHSSFYGRLKQKNNIQFLEEIEYSKVLKIYQHGDVFVLPSYGEGLPKAALEAASLSLPLILSNVSGCKECIEGNGYLVEKENPQKLAESMSKFLLEPKMMREMGKKSNQLIKKKFSLEKISSEYLSLIEETKV